jgi:thioredoxin-dependent peroxiredoxin
VFVIFFYPKDESMVCTKEACTFRDSMNLFKQYGVQVIGINQGSVESHKKFQKDDNLNFELLSDTDKTVIKEFGVKGTMFTERVTFVVDISGQIVFKTESTTDGKKHIRETLAYIRQMKKSSGH